MTGAPGAPFGNLAPDPADFRKFFIFFLNFSLLIFFVFCTPDIDFEFSVFLLNFGFWMFIISTFCLMIFWALCCYGLEFGYFFAFCGTFWLVVGSRWAWWDRRCLRASICVLHGMVFVAGWNYGLNVGEVPGCLIWVEYVVCCLFYE